MDGSRDLSSRESAFARSFLARTLTRQSTRASTDEPVANGVSKGPLGLTTLYDPQAESVVADVIFVHGLNGGSQSTWSKGNNPAAFWPREWLPRDEAFRDVRIHSFGYASGISRDSILGLRDFAKSLLGAIKDCPAMGRGDKVSFPLTPCRLPVALSRQCHPPVAASHRRAASPLTQSTCSSPA